MSLVSLELAKQHLRVDHDVEDELIQAYIDSAEDQVNRYLDREEPYETYPPAVVGAVLLLVGALYDHREAIIVDSRELHEHPAVLALLGKYRRLTL